MNPSVSAQPDITLFYDAACPLCDREAAFLRRLDRARNRLGLIDASAREFDPTRYGLTHERVNDHIHGVLADGSIVTGMEAFRRAYRAVGLGWLLAPTGWPVLKPVFDTLYGWFAKNRYRLTGRCRSGACPAPE